MINGLSKRDLRQKAMGASDGGKIVGMHSNLLSATLKMQKDMALDWVETNKLLDRLRCKPEKCVEYFCSHHADFTITNLDRTPAKALEYDADRLLRYVQVGPPVVRLVFFLTAIVTATSQSQALLAVAMHWKSMWAIAVAFVGFWILGPLRQWAGLSSSLPPPCDSSTFIQHKLH